MSNSIIFRIHRLLPSTHWWWILVRIACLIPTRWSLPWIAWILDGSHRMHRCLLLDHIVVLPDHDRPTRCVAQVVGIIASTCWLPSICRWVLLEFEHHILAWHVCCRANRALDLRYTLMIKNLRMRCRIVLPHKYLLMSLSFSTCTQINNLIVCLVPNILHMFQWFLRMCQIDILRFLFITEWF